MTDYRYFTSESVSEGHPDKVADQIADAVLDEMLAHDPESRVACEVLIKSGLVVIAGEVRTRAKPDLDRLARQVIAEIGYSDAQSGFDLENCAVINALGRQSGDIAQGVDQSAEREQGAGDQGLMFGYATDETDEFMPAPIAYAHRLVQRQAQARRSALADLLRPDAKSQLTFRYDDQGKPIAIEALVLSTQHVAGLSQKRLTEAVMEEIVKPVLPSRWLTERTKYHINPTGRFEIGGPAGDCGLTGRKIIVDTYGGMARHGGGAFSGKDPSKVDRSAAYAARHLAKNIVAAGLAQRCEIQISYAIGVAQPTSLSVNSFGTGKLQDDRIARLVGAHFDLRPGALIEQLRLKRPIYKGTAAYGHFGRAEEAFTWERTDRAEALAAELPNP